MAQENTNQSIWGNFTNLLSKIAGKAYDSYAPQTVKNLVDIPGYATDKAAELFPSDNGKQNAMRHSLWMGRTAQELGGGPGATLLAKLAGYGFEGLTAAPTAIGHLLDGNVAGAKAVYNDSKQDLNNNAVGIAHAAFRNPKQLEDELRRMANGVVTADPEMYERKRPYLTQEGQTKKVTDLLADTRR